MKVHYGTGVCDCGKIVFDPEGREVCRDCEAEEDTMTPDKALERGWTAHRMGLEFDHRLDTPFVKALPAKAVEKLVCINAWSKGWCERNEKVNRKEIAP